MEAIAHTPLVHPLSDAERQQFDGSGYLLLPGTVDPSTIKLMRSTLEKLLAPFAKDGEDFFQTCIRLNAEVSPALYQAYQVSHQTEAMGAMRRACLSQVHRYLGKHEGVLIDVDSHIIFGMPNSTRLTWGWHQESTYDVFDGKGFNFCVPIFEPASVHNGTMSFLKGTHRFGKLPFDKHKEHENGATTLVPKDIGRLQAEHEEVFFEAAPGDAVMFDRNLIHRSNLNRSERPRITAVIRFMEIQELPASFDKPY